MKFTKSKIRRLNDLLRAVRDDRDAVISVIEELCPGVFNECDAQISSSREAVNCPYFVLCNVMGSYSLISDDERREADQFLDNLYKKIKCRSNEPVTIYS